LEKKFVTGSLKLYETTGAQNLRIFVQSRLTKKKERKKEKNSKIL